MTIIVRSCALVLVSLLLAPLALAEQGKLTQIGVITPLSGDFSWYGEMVRSGVSSAPHESVQFVFQDEKCNARDALASYQQLRQQGVKLFIGPSCGAGQEALAPIVANDDVLLLLPSSSSAALFKRSNGKIFSTQYSIEAESRFNAQAMYAAGYRRVLIFFVDSPFARAHEAAFRESFKGRIVDTIALSSFDSSALKAVVPRLSSMGYDAIYVPDASPFMLGLNKEIAAAHVPARPIYSIFAAQSENVVQAEGEAANGVIYSFPDIHSEAVHYYPHLAAKTLNGAVAKCGSEIPCIRKVLFEEVSFDNDGVMPSPIILKTIKGKEFNRIPTVTDKTESAPAQ